MGDPTKLNQEYGAPAAIDLSDSARYTHGMPQRRLVMRQLAALGLAPLLPNLAGAADAHPGLPDPRPLQLGQAGSSWRDHGSHPEWGTEWWYITGQLRANGGNASATAQPDFGFQLTFFRTRVPTADADATATGAPAPGNPPNTTPRHAATAPPGLSATHLISAHLAVSDVATGRLLHEERVARATAQPALGMGEAAVGDLGVRLGNWRLQRAGQQLQARLPGQALGLDLRFTPTQAPIVQGDGGLSRKGPDVRQISYYYSWPQLAVQGQLQLGQRKLAVRGTAWMDHEWSTALMHPNAVGWDWVGMNLADGSALTAFRLRDAQGQALWTGGSWRDARGQLRVFGGQSLRFEALKHWTSTATKAIYPTRWAIHTPVGDFVVQAVFDNQELDGRGSTGAIYWEGLSALQDPQGRPLGWGYLEMTGYAGRIRFN